MCRWRVGEWENNRWQDDRRRENEATEDVRATVNVVSVTCSRRGELTGG